MSARTRPLALLALAIVTLTSASPAEPTPEPIVKSLLGDGYRLEASVAFPAALLHWLDSLAHVGGAGMTAGKTVDAHRLTFNATFGQPTEKDLRLLRNYRELRQDFVQSHRDDPSAVTVAFFDAARLDDALANARGVLDENESARLDSIVEHFAPKYGRIWDDGRVPAAFLKSARHDRHAAAFAQFLVGVAGFFGVDPAEVERPRLVLTPVRNGYGTHAQALDRFLLIEVRPSDGLLDQIAPIAHENAHFLYYGMGDERISELRDASRAQGADGREAWQYLQEALPTAIAQGVASATFTPQRFSMDDPWYHIEEIDDFAKQIYPNVERALAAGRRLDRALIEELVAVYSGEEPPEDGSEATPRSP